MKRIAFACAVTLAACSAPDTAPDRAATPSDANGAPTVRAVHPASGLELIEVTIDTGDARHIFTAELADTAEAQRQGLMFRTELGDDEAMLFPSISTQVRSFWMKNTPLPLDIIFIGADGRITNIETGVPYSTESVHSDGPASAVLEVRKGRAEALGIAPGNLVEYAFPG